MKAIFIFQIFLTAIFFSCSEKNYEDTKITKQQNEFFLQFQDRFNEVGVNNVYDNYTLSDNEIKNLKAVTNNLPNTQMALFKSEYSDGSNVYGFSLPKTKEYLTIKLRGGELVRLFKAKLYNLESDTNELVLRTENDVILQSFTLSNNIDERLSNRGGNDRMSQKLTPDCDELGERRDGESFDDCFKRNWSNFCCDFVGCIAQITNPVSVATAITLVCLC